MIERLEQEEEEEQQSVDRSELARRLGLRINAFSEWTSSLAAHLPTTTTDTHLVTVTDQNRRKKSAMVK